MKRLLLCLGAMAAPLLAGPAAVRGQNGAEPHQVKAAFVSRFPQFVEWPYSAFQGRDSLEICVWEPDPFDGSLDRMVEGEELRGRPLNVRHIDRRAAIEGCHVLVVSPMTDRAAGLLRLTSGEPILTIGETPAFLEAGGVLRLMVIDQRVRFAINADAAERAGLQLSSQLLRLAVNVRGGP